jgi:hypothetical protein
MLGARYAGPPLTGPAVTAAELTGVYNRNANPFAEPTMRTAVRRAVTGDLAGPTGDV